MTEKVQLNIAAVSQLRQFGNVGLIILTGEQQSKQVSILCDYDELRYLKANFHNQFCPEDSLISVLWKIIGANTSHHYEVYIADIKRGKYQVFLQTDDGLEQYELEPTAAMTLAAVAELPIYMSAELFAKQSAIFDPEKDRMCLPLNALNITVLEHALHRAIDAEDYKMASVIKKEMDNRKN